MTRRKAKATERKFDISETGSCPSTAMVIILSVELIIILSHKIRMLIQALTLTLGTSASSLRDALGTHQVASYL